MIKILNTLTHDVYNPRLYGFCFLVMHDKETGDVIFQHNGLRNITDKEFDALGDLVKEIYPFVLEKKLQEKEAVNSKEFKDTVNDTVNDTVKEERNEG